MDPPEVRLSSSVPVAELAIQIVLEITGFEVVKLEHTTE